MIRSTTAILVLLFAVSEAAAAAEPEFRRIPIDPAFRSEGVAVADVDRDGRLDVIAGDVWYQCPGDAVKRAKGIWKVRAFRPPGAFVAGDFYSNSFANFAGDFSGDGFPDVIVVGFPGDPILWYENPGEKVAEGAPLWKEHTLWHSACNESPEFEPLAEGGPPVLIVGSQPESRMGYLAAPEPGQARGKWPFAAVSRPGPPKENGTFKYYHGLGVGDVDGDGDLDVMIPHGFWRNPAVTANEREQANADGSWPWQPWRLHLPEDLAPGDNAGRTPPRAANMYADDLDGDGDADIVMSSAHAFGMWWFENPGPAAIAEAAGSEAGPAFKAHSIDQTVSQLHALERADLDGDGDLEYVTGKRFYAHNGNDPGAEDPVTMQWYDIRRGEGGSAPEFTKHEIPAGEGTGVGTQFLLRDMNADGRPDIVLANKKGVFILEQVGK